MNMMPAALSVGVATSEKEVVVAVAQVHAAASVELAVVFIVPVTCCLSKPS